MESPTTSGKTQQRSQGIVGRERPTEPHPKRILLVNGEPLISKLVCHALRAAQHEVLSASNAGQALALATQEDLDLILVDLWLSGSYGTSLVRELAKLAGPPIVIFSDEPTDDELKRALDAGAVDYVTNPTSCRELLERIQLALANGWVI